MSISEHAAWDVSTVNRRLARTINILSDLCIAGYPLTLDAEHFDICQQAGFTALRLPIQWVAHMAKNSSFTVAPALFERVDWALEQAGKRGMALILDNHLDPELMADPPAYRERFLALWQQLAEHYQAAPPDMLFEVLAEPIQNLEPLWNEYVAQALSVIRESDPTRAVIVGPTHYNNLRRLHALQLPESDRHLIVTIHQYYPVEFTMQGEMWLSEGNPEAWLGTQFTATDEERHLFEQGFDAVAAWGKEHERPIFLGEFGTTDNADAASRLRWTRLNREEAEKHDFSWGYWSFAHSFSVYDIQTRHWRTALLEALIQR
jgi:endoglucanase